MKKHNFTEKEIVEIRRNLYIEDKELDEYWEEDLKEDTLSTLWKHKELIEKENVAYCLEYDLDYENDYLDEDDLMMKILIKEKGIIIYERIEKEIM